MPNRQDLDDNKIARRLRRVNTGDCVCFNDRTKPLRVVNTHQSYSGVGGDTTGVVIEGERGGQYLLSSDGTHFRRLRSAGYRRDLWWFEKCDGEK